MVPIHYMEKCNINISFCGIWKYNTQKSKMKLYVWSIRVSKRQNFHLESNVFCKNSLSCNWGSTKYEFWNQCFTKDKFFFNPRSLVSFKQPLWNSHYLRPVLKVAICVYGEKFPLKPLAALCLQTIHGALWLISMYTVKKKEKRSQD